MSTLPFVNFSKTGLTITVDDITILSDRAIPVALPDSMTQHIYAYIGYLPAPYVTIKLRTSTKIEQAILSHQMFKGTVLTLYFRPQLRRMNLRICLQAVALLNLISPSLSSYIFTSWLSNKLFGRR
jgi:hypothetical protein